MLAETSQAIASDIHLSIAIELLKHGFDAKNGKAVA